MLDRAMSVIETPAFAPVFGPDALAEVPLAALVGLPAPESAGQQINGTSLVPAFDDPEGSAGMKDAAYSQFAKPSRARPFVFWPFAIRASR